MKRILLSFLIVLSLTISVGLGGVGGCGGGATLTTVGASLTLPTPLRDLTGYQVSLTLTNILDGSTVFGPTLLTLDPLNNLWETDVEGVDEQDLVATIQVIVPTPFGDTVVSQAVRAISILKDAPFATLTFSPGNFDLDLDNDDDTVSNLTEYELNLNPFSSDTDGDGISDAESLPL